MRKLAMEVQMPAATFNDAGDCLGQVRQLLGALRSQLRAEGNIKGQIQISILVKTGGEMPVEVTTCQHDDPSWCTDACKPKALGKVN